MPLEPLIGHIDSLATQMEFLKSDVDKVPYPSVRRTLNYTIDNYRNGLNIIREGLRKVIIRNARNVVELAEKQGKSPTLEQIIYSNYQELVRESYGLAERFNTDITMLVGGVIQPELYHWLLEIPEFFGIKIPLVFREGANFETEKFESRIVDPLEHLIELARGTNIPGSLKEVEPVDLIKENPVGVGHIISCIRGEAQNPVLWPILCHEVFETVDKEIGLFKKLEAFVSSEDIVMPTLDEDPITNKHWIMEIFMDYLAIHFFGPAYAISLLEYFKRSPYYPTESHPDAPSRLFVIFQHLNGPIESELDILGRCQVKAREIVEEEIRRYEKGNQRDTDKKKKLALLYDNLKSFLRTFKTPLFLDTLKDYDAQSVKLGAKLAEQSKDGILIPFRDPLLNFEDIRKDIFEYHVSLAIHPNIVLNVVLANYDLYRKNEHFDVIVDSMKKWKIKRVWNNSAIVLNETL